MKNYKFMKRLLVLALILIASSPQMWALSDGETWYEGNSPYLYFNNINSNYNGVSVVQGRQWTYGRGSAGSQAYAMTAISNTKLYYIHQGLYDHYTTQCFVDRNGGSGWTDWSSTAVASRVTTYAHNYTNSYNLTYTSDKVYVFTAASSSKNASLTKSVDAASGYSSLNKTITVKAKVSTDGGSTYSTATSPGSLSASSNKFTAYNSCASAQSLSSGTITCGYTATTTLTAADATGYDFVGWYNSSGTQQTTSKTLTIYPTANATYYAYYKEKRYNVTAVASPAAGGSVTPTSATAMGQITGGSITATPNTGYTFGGWSITSGSGSFSSSTSTASNTFKPTAASTVTASFNAINYTITYNNMDGATNHASNPSTYTIESAAITLQDPKKTGYMFGGWYTDEELTTPVGTPAIAAGSTGNKVFYAKWTEITLTEVSASPSTGGTGVQTMTVSFKTNVPRNSGYYYRVAEFGGKDAGTTGGGFHSNGNGITSGDASTLITSGEFSTINFTTSGVYTSAIEIYTDGPLTVQKRVTFTYGAGDYYTVSFNLQGHGSDIDNQVILSGSKVTEPSPAPTATGYTFGGWYKEAACTNAWNFASDAVTSDKTLFAKWTANQYTIAFDKEGGSGGSDNVTVYYDATLGAFASAPTRTGYTFAGYWTGDNGTGTMLFAANGAPQASVGSYTDGSVKWIYAGNPTVYAKWTENTVTVSPTNHYDAGNPGYSAPTASNSGTVGIVSTSQLVAPAPSTGYTFAGWTLSNNLVVTVGNAATDRTITVRTNGDGNAVSATANYNEDLSSPYTLKGGTNVTGDNWATAHNFTKKTGHSTESVAYCTFNVSSTNSGISGSATDWSFKVLNGGIWYGLSADGDSWWYQRNSGQQTLSTSGKNIQLCADVAGPYEIKVDYTTPASPKVTVTFPTSYTLTYAIGSVNGTSGSITTSPTTASGSKVLSGNTVTLTGPAAKTGYTWKGWYTNAAGTEGKIADVSRAITVTMNANKTLYACYTENTYNVSASATPAGYGTVTPTSSTSMGQINGGNITASPNAGYSFSGWSIASGSGYFGASGTATTSATAKTKFRPTANATLTGTFAEVLRTVTVAVNNSYLGSVSTTSLTSVGPVTKSAEVTATPVDGATFTGWGVESGLTIAGGYTSSSNPVKVNATAASKTLTANFTETTYTVTLTTADASKGTVGSSTSAGQITAMEINATPKSGYMFSKWVKTGGSGTVTYYTGPGNGQVTDASGDEKETTYICVTGDVTLQATWEADRSSGYVVHYGNSGKNADGGTDASQTRPWKDGKLYRATTAASDVSYFTFTAGVGDVDKVIEFKIHQLSPSTWYGYGSSSGEKIDKDISNEALSTDYGNGRLCITMPGSYLFTWDKSTNKLSIRYPNDVYYVRGGFNSWDWSHPMTEVRSGVYAATINLTEANHTYEANTSAGFKVLIAGKYYGKNGTTVTRANSTGSADISGCNTTGNNFGLTTDFIGNYTFEYTVASNTLKVIYPTAYTVTYGVGTGYSSMGSVSTSPSVTSGRYVLAGSEIVFTATPNLGYKFVGWYREAACTNEVSTDNPYEPTISETTTLYAKFAYRDLYIQADWLGWSTAQLTQSTDNRAIYTYEIDNVAARETSSSSPYNNGYHFRIMNANNGGDDYLAYTYNDVQTPTGSGFLSNSDIHLTDAGNPTIQYNLTHKSKITITLTLQSVDDATKPTVNIAADRYYDINYTAPSHGSYTIQVGVAGAVSANTEARAGTTITLANTPSTGYSFGSWTVAKSAGTVTVSNNQFTMPAEDVTVSASFTPNTYQVRFHRNGGAGDVVYQNFTYDVAQNLTANTYTKTGYNFAGWALAADAAVTYADEANVSNLTATNEGIFHLYAKWTPMSCTVEFDFDESDAGFGNKSGATTDVTATYDAAMTSVTPPTAANGYAFMGYYDDADGEGTQYYNADGTSARAWDKATEDNVTLYAYYKQAEITSVTFDDDIVEPGATVTATASIDPEPEGTTIICWRLLHDNGNEYSPQPTFTPASGTSVSFTAPETSTHYKVEAKLRTGSSCGGGTLLDTETGSFQVAGSHTVTVNYKCGDDVIKAATSVTATPLDWTEEFTAPDIFGYAFARWDAADGVTIKNGESDPVTTTTNATIQIKATYNGKLTAVYTQKSMIFFKNTLGWSDVYVNFYTSSYWNNPKGSGNQGVTNRNKHMTQLDDTDIWYYDYGAASITPSLYVSFTSASQDGSEFFWKSGGVNVVYPANYPDAINTDKSSETGFKAATPMFVPLATQDKVTLNQSSGGKADYYNAGYWTKYTPGTGYRLEIYNNSSGAFIKAQDFTSADDLMPMKATVDLEGGQTYKFQLRRGGESSAGIYYGNSGTMTYANHGQGTPWAMTNSPFSMAGITTNAAGDYTFNLSYSPNADDQYRLRIAVDYPVADGDYRLIYKDAIHTNWHPSAIVSKGNDRKDTVSFFVRPGSSPEMKIQTATVNPSTGAVTWGSDVAIPTATLTGLTSTDVYNFNLSMDGSGNISLEGVDTYTGNFYIRTDAANSKWDNYRNDPDHLMVYSEYSIEHGGYTHYHAHWVNKDETGRKNVKFTIANDYSPCISDTLTREAAEGTWANIDDFMTTGGDLKRSANVRFMWDKRDNSISRAYVDGAQGDYSTNFLYMLNVEAGADKIRKSDESALTDHKVTFKDNGNWMYEANIQAQPTAQIKLLSNWGESPTITQYFRGAADDTETLLGGSGDTWYDIRIIYDFKTNRLIAGLIPSGNYTDELAINADVMFIREHQGDIAQLTFTGDGAITDIETAYGVLQFNKWTLNNKSKADGHSPLSPLLSAYERDLFYVSFPFRVSMEEVFGFGTYGTHWIIEEYDGASRAANGYWQESGPNWKFVFNRKNKFFEPGQGYIIALDLDELGESSDVWTNTDQVELYFPSYGTMDNITSSTATYEIPSHLCTINRTVDASGNPTGLPADYDRRVKDSHWNVLGVPTYVNPDAPNFANTDWTTEASETSIGPNFLYEWNKDDNSVSAVSASGYTYHAMHAYLVQYCGNVTWTSSVSVKPSDIVARRMSAEKPQNVEFKIELSQNDKAVDQTYIKLSDDERVTTDFEFNYDLSKEYNKNKANIYTLIGTEPVAGNVLPLTEQTTVIPVGVKIAANGDYTFAIPEGTDGIGITLIDNGTGIRTSLSALDYTINLNAGTYNDRFLLEISPVHQSPTAIELLNGENGENGVRKVLIDNILYIVKDGVMYDARGNRVQ